MSESSSGASLDDPWVFAGPITHNWFVQFIIQLSSLDNDLIQFTIHIAYLITFQSILAVVNFLWAKFFNPFSTNLLYWVHWANIPVCFGLGLQKRVPTIGVVCGENLCNSECNGQVWWDQDHSNKGLQGPNDRTTSLTLSMGETEMVACIP